MLIQLIYHHPLTDSYNHALFETIHAALDRKDHQVEATDLYREQFDPVMREPERRSYYAAQSDESMVSAHTAPIRRADGIILYFPHWWFSMPAMLKGYFDRVWARGIAFERDLAKGYIRPLLTRLRLFGVVTTYGSPWGITRAVAGDPAARS
jgi:NAD(P)H dehydrogenase (quinone)